MRATLDKAPLADALGRVVRACGKKDDIYACVKLDAGSNPAGGYVGMAANNGTTMSIRAKASATVGEVGAVAVDGLRLYEAVQSMRTPQVALEVVGSRLLVQGGTSNLWLPLQDVATFPTVHNPQGDNCIMHEVVSRLLAAALTAVQHAVAKGGQTDGVWLDNTGARGMQTATGATALVPLPPGALPDPTGTPGPVGVALPAVAVEAVLAACARGPLLRLGCYAEGGEGKRLYLRDEASELCVTLGHPGAWPKAVPVVFTAVGSMGWRMVTVAREALLDACRLVRVASTGKRALAAVAMQWANGTLTLGSDDASGAALVPVAAPARPQPDDGAAPALATHLWPDGSDTCYLLLATLVGHLEACEGTEVQLGLCHTAPQHAFACTVATAWAAGPPPPAGGTPPQLTYSGFCQAMAPPANNPTPAL